MAIHQAFIYDQPDQGGRSDYFYFCNARFGRFPVKNTGLNGVNSVSILPTHQTTPEVKRTSLVIFGSNLTLTGGTSGGTTTSLPSRPWHSDFVQFTNASRTVVHHNLTSYLTNRTGLYILLFGLSDSLTQCLPAGQVFEALWNRTLAANKPGGISIIGDPQLTWDFNPSIPKVQLLTITQKLMVDLSFPFRDREASFTYWIYFFIDQNGQPDCRVSSYRITYQTGIFKDEEVANRLMNLVWNSTFHRRITFNFPRAFNNFILPGSTFKDIYLLPDSQIYQTDILQGNSKKDTTLCLVST